jgi:hypothetical protein
MYLELAWQWLKSNGYIIHSDLYYIRKTDKHNLPVDMVAIHKNTIFEIYWAETKIEEKKSKKVFVPDVTNYEVKDDEIIPVEKKVKKIKDASKM